MPSREAPSYSSSRVQRASRLNALEQVRLQHKLMLLEKARLHQARLTNQDIRLTSVALEYILNCSGHSSEGRGPEGQQRGADPVQQEDPCFLYGERVMSRKKRRMPRPHSAVERATFRRQGTQDDSQSPSSARDPDTSRARSQLPPRPRSSPAKGRSWAWSGLEEEGSEVDSERPRSRGLSGAGASRPSTASSGPRSRASPHQAWDDDTDEVTRRLIKVQQQREQQQQQHHQQQQNSRRNGRYMQDISRMQSSPVSRPVSGKQSRTSPFASSPSPRIPSVGPSTSPVIEDRPPVSPRQRRAKSGGPGRRAGLTEIVSQARATMSASAWRSHLAGTQTVPRSAESQRQVILEARRDAEKQRQQQVMQRMENFMGTLNKNT